MTEVPACRAGTRRRKRRRKFEPFLPLIIMRNARSAADITDERSRNIKKAIFVSPREVAAHTALTPLYPAVRQNRQSDCTEYRANVLR